jgi:O-antigen/teichoic acid export membrane protein
MGDLSKALGSLLVASVATALVLNVSPLAVQILATADQSNEPGRFLNALLVARVPLFFFQAVQAALLPRLSTLASQNKFAELWHELKHLLVLVGALGVGAVAVMAAIGPQIVEMAFGAEFAVSRQDMVLLAASSAGLMVVLSLTQALIACRAQGRMALAWVLGVVAFPLTLVLAGDQLFLRVELALIATVLVAAVAMFVLLLRRLAIEKAFV